MDILDAPAVDKQSWPPPYTLRRSTKARNTFLQIKKNSGLEIVIPARQRSINIEQLLNDKRHWIEKILNQNASIPATQPVPPALLPTTLYCQAIAETWHIFYLTHPIKKIKLITSLNSRIIWLKGNIENQDLCKKILKQWLIKLANQHLIPWLHRVSIESNLPYHQAMIRGQTTLWGSCNSKKNISLNYKLLFLPPSLAKHVLLHELCHTKYLNHSHRFWEFLNKFDEQSYENRRFLKTADVYVPGWL
jgi:predicted metal-dependent hydrolase